MIKDYIIKERLGVGAFGLIYKVQKKSNNKILVLKQIPLIDLTQKEIKNAKLESEILSSVNSPYIVKYYESFEENNYLNIVMEYCDGGDLSEFISKNKSNHILLNEDLIWNIFIKILIGLAELHKNKILHRDLKTMNIFLTKNLDIKLGDFGVAKILNQSDFANTIIGTPYYLSPELCEKLPYNDKSDIWALGCILYELCTFNHPFDADCQASLMLKILKNQPQRIHKSYSDNLQKLIYLILDKNQETRPSCKDILDLPYVIENSKKYGLYDDIKNIFPENNFKCNIKSNKYRNKSYSSKRINDEKNKYDKNTFQKNINKIYNINNIFYKKKGNSISKKNHVLYISKSNENITKFPKEAKSLSQEKNILNPFNNKIKIKKNYITKITQLNNDINFISYNNKKIQIKPIKTNISNRIKNTIDEYELKIKKERKNKEIKKFCKDRNPTLNILNFDNEEEMFKNIKTTDILENKEIDNMIQNKLLKMKKDKKEINIKEFALSLNNNISKIKSKQLNNNIKNKKIENKSKDKRVFNPINFSIDINTKSKIELYEKSIIKKIYKNNYKKDNKYYKNIRLNKLSDSEEKKSDSKIFKINHSININNKYKKNKLFINRNIIHRINSAVYNKNKKDEKNRYIFDYSTNENKINHEYQ